MPADYTRIHRLLKILTLIQSDRGWTAERLARECGVTVRTIYRDMKMLEGAGIPYFYDEPTRGYAVRRDFFMPAVQLTLDESLALIALAEHIGGGEQIPLTRAAGKAIAKVRSTLPPEMRDQLAAIEKHVAIHLARAGPHEGIRDVYDKMRDAISRRRAVNCRYESAGRYAKDKDRDRPFRFDPYTLLFSQRAWYVIGHHHDRGEQRCLKLNRFSEVQPTKQAYTVPKDFSVEDRLGNAWRMIRGEKSYKVELHFDASFAETIADTHWHRTQEVDYQEDGSIVFRCTVDGLDEIVWWVLSMGPHCVVRKPRALASRVKQLAAETAQKYQ